MSSKSEHIESTWRDHFNRHSLSDLTIREYCFQNQLAEASFYYWRKKLKFSSTAAIAFKASTGAVFAELPVKGPLTNCRTSFDTIEVESPRGFRIRLSADFSVSAFQRALQVLEPLL